MGQQSSSFDVDDASVEKLPLEKKLIEEKKLKGETESNEEVDSEEMKTDDVEELRRIIQRLRVKTKRVEGERDHLLRENEELKNENENIQKSRSLYSREKIKRLEGAIEEMKQSKRRTLVRNTLEGLDEELKKEIMENYRSKRGHVIKELYLTERSYMKCLGILKNRYVAEIAKKKLLKRDFDDIRIFKHLEEVHKTNKDFLEQLEDKVLRQQPEEDFILVFLKFCKSFRNCYENYVKYKGESQELLNKMEKKYSKFGKFLFQTKKKVEDENRASGSGGSMDLGIASLIQKPATRLPRYRMLLRQLLKHTHKEETELFEKLSKAWESVNLTVEHCDKVKGEYETSIRVAKLAEAIKVNSLLEKRYILDRVLEFRNKFGTYSPCKLFVFEDVFVIKEELPTSSPVTQMNWGGLSRATKIPKHWIIKFLFELGTEKNNNEPGSLTGFSVETKEEDKDEDEKMLGQVEIRLVVRESKKTLKNLTLRFRKKEDLNDIAIAIDEERKKNGLETFRKNKKKEEKKKKKEEEEEEEEEEVEGENEEGEK